MIGGLNSPKLGELITAAGVAVDVVGLPSWIKRMTVLIDGVSVSSSSTLMLRLGSAGGVESSNYNGRGIYINSGGAGDHDLSTGVHFYGTGAAVAKNYGKCVFTKHGGNIWTFEGAMGAETGDARDSFVVGSKSLAGVLDRVRITTLDGTSVFDAGTINVMYE